MSVSNRSIANAAIPPTAVFICSAGHSGSTLLDLLLGSHPVAMSLGEITQLPKNLALDTDCSCGCPVRVCPVWSSVTAELARHPRFRRIAENPYVLNLGLFRAGTVIDRAHQTVGRLLYRKAIYSAAFMYWRWHFAPLAVSTAPLRAGAINKWLLFEIISETVSRSLLVDSSKHYLEAVALHAAEPRRTKILLLVRDGRAVFYSGLKRGMAPAKALGAWWRTYRRALPVLRRQVPRRDWLQVRYEDLVSDPAQELHRICEFIGVGFDSRMLDFRAKRHHVLSGNDMRFAKSAQIRMDEAWKTKLSPSNLVYFETNAGALNRELGY